MPWWMFLLVFLAGVFLIMVGLTNSDDVFGLLQKIIGLVMVVVAMLSGHLVPLELAGLAVAIWLPAAARFDRG
jgi:hypothetical protein